MTPSLTQMRADGEGGTITDDPAHEHLVQERPRGVRPEASFVFPLYGETWRPGDFHRWSAAASVRPNLDASTSSSSLHS